MPGGDGHQPTDRLCGHRRKFLSFRGRIERFFEELLDPGRRLCDQHTRALRHVSLTRGLGDLPVRRAETETGADYYVAPPGMGIEDQVLLVRRTLEGSPRHVLHLKSNVL